MTSSTTFKRYLWSTTFGVLALGAACGDSTPTGATTDAGIIAVTPQATALIDGISWRANYHVEGAVGDYYAAEQRMEINAIEIGPDNAGRQISLFIRGFKGPGTYTFDTMERGGPFAYLVASPNVAAAPAVRDQQDAEYFSMRSGAGTVTVTSYDDFRRWITGTFSVDVSRAGQPDKVVHITNGVFAGRVVTGT